MAMFTPSQRARLDDIVDELFVNTSSSAKSRFPRCNFTKGFTNLTLLSASECVGIAFTFLLIARTDKGYTLDRIYILTGFIPTMSSVPKRVNHAQAQRAGYVSRDYTYDSTYLVQNY